MDPDLPFYYYTSNEKFSVDTLPSFDKAPLDAAAPVEQVVTQHQNDEIAALWKLYS